MAFCSNCGAELPAGAMFCSKCGREVNSTAAPQAQAATSGGEVFLGGVFGLAKRRGLAYFADFGLFLTDRRLIILNKNVIPNHGIPWISRMKDEINLEMNATPSDLDQLKKEVEIRKADIKDVELKKPGIFTKGHMTITTTSGGTTKLAFMEGQVTGEYEGALALLQKFLPGRIRLV